MSFYSFKIKIMARNKAIFCQMNEIPQKIQKHKKNMMYVKGNSLLKDDLNIIIVDC